MRSPCRILYWPATRNAIVSLGELGIQSPQVISAFINSLTLLKTDTEWYVMLHLINPDRFQNPVVYSNPSLFLLTHRLAVVKTISKHRIREDILIDELVNCLKSEEDG